MEMHNAMSLTTLKALTAKEGRAILILGPYCWGKGQTGAEAYRKARENLSYGGDHPKFFAFDVPADAVVTGMGSIQWNDSKQETKELGLYIGKR